MQLNVNPNRMELLRLRRRLLLAQRGHKLLQDKLDEMMHRFLSLIKETHAVSIQLNKKVKQLFLRLVISRGLMQEEDFTRAVRTARINLDFECSLAKIMNVSIPQFKFTPLETIEQTEKSKMSLTGFREPELKLDYIFSKVSPELDIALDELKNLLLSLIRLAELLKSCQLLSFEIERTRRRVNALEYLLIPSISQTIRSISDKLNELERENLLRLMRIKEILRQ